MQATGNRPDMQCNLQQQREYGEPHEGNGAVPWFVTSIVAGLLVFGVVYIVRAPINSMPPARGDARVLAELQTPPKVAGAAVDGAAVYTARCASCHQATGAGVPSAQCGQRASVGGAAVRPPTIRCNRYPDHEDPDIQ